MFIGGRVVDMCPSFMRSAAMAVARLPAQYLFSKLKAIIEPEIRRREAKMDSKVSVQGMEQQSGAQEDMLTWSIAQERLERRGGSAKSQSCAALDDDTINKICPEIMILIVASTHTLAITLSWTVFALLAAPAEKKYTERMRQEVTQVLGKGAADSSSRPQYDADSPALWTRRKVAELSLVDSAIRETMRLEPVSAMLPVWKMQQDTTVEIPDGGPTVRLRKGTRVCLPATLMHLDESVYPKATQFDPFRFADRRLPLSTPNASFLSWSIGRWACTGRYYASNTMKLVLAELLTKYDVELTGETRRRGQGQPGLRLGISLNPDLSAKMKVRFRAE